MGARNIILEEVWVLIALALLACAVSIVSGIEPSAPTRVQNLSTESPTPSIGQALNTSGGTISTINIDATTQNPRWKGFVGNITGKFALQDANGFSLYDWTLLSTLGEVYTTRNSTLVSWPSVACATVQNISNEDNALGFNASDVDNINHTFNYTSHLAFYAGDTLIAANSCRSTFLFVNSTSQTQYFREVLLHDMNVIYTGLIENSSFGYRNGSRYDYQLIVPDNTNQGATSEIYYLYIELI